jgi:Fic-DOC domain mobile mystery protein B
VIRRFEFPEGATPIADCSGLIPTWVHHLDDLNRVEAENIALAQRKYLRMPVADPKTWFYVKELKTIHRAMFGNVWEWAGIYRQSMTSIGIKPSLIPARLAEFCAEVLSWSQHPVELTFVERAARIHHQLVLIHPFENGNGRFSRLIADRFLLAWRCPHPIWPSRLNQNSQVRKEYVQALKSADAGCYEALISFMKKLGATDPTLVDLLKNNFYRTYIKGDKGSALVKALLRNIGKEEALRGLPIVHLAEKSGLENIMKLLIDFGLK